MDWDKVRVENRIKHNGSMSKSARPFIPANDPIKVAARRRKRERDARPLPAAEAFGLDRPVFKKLNAEYKALRIAGKAALSYNDWMRERLRPADQSGL